MNRLDDKSKAELLRRAEEFQKFLREPKEHRLSLELSNSLIIEAERNHIARLILYVKLLFRRRK